MTKPKKAPPSARGLFNATGKKSKPVAVRKEGGGYEKAPARERSENDFDPTPPEPIWALIHVEGDRMRDFDVIWEGSAGDGAIVRELVDAGFKVFASDLIDRGAGFLIRDYYDFRRKDRPARATVQNPPFSECNWGHGKARWLKHSLEELDLDYMALLLPWSWPGAEGLGPFWDKHPPSRVYLMRWRIDFTGQGASPMLNAWWVWDRNHTGPTTVHMLDRVDIRQATLF